MRSIVFTLLSSIYFIHSPVFAQQSSDKQLKSSEMESLVLKIADSLAFYYVSADEGIQIGNYLKNQLDQGAYNKSIEPEEFAKKLTNDLRSINGDLHLYVKYHDDGEKLNKESKVERLDTKGLMSNYGLMEIQFLESNIAYLKIDHFSNWNHANKARQKISEIIGLFKNNESLIIDLRDNRGGVPYVASYLASYFFDEKPVHLADFYTRFNNTSYGIYTEPFVPGAKMPHKSLFILVNENSASAAEEFAFWLQNQERAVIIGQPTSGAGYGALNHKLNERFSISISSEEEIDPISKKGFQGSGVMPDTIVDSSNALAVALSLAKLHIEKEGRKDSLELQQFYELIEDKNLALSESEILEQVILLNQIDYLDYDAIYNLGNLYIKEPKKALPILRANTILYPFYPHPFEDYAKALVEAKDYPGALRNFDKAVQLAELKKNPNVDQFRSNREKFLNEYKSSIRIKE